MATFLCLCTFILGANYLFAVSAQSVENEILNAEGRSSIVGGEKIKIDQAPFLAQLLEDDEQVCGSSILSPYWIVTAAHCVNDDGSYSILTGSSISSRGRNRHEIEEIIVHDSYDEDTVDNDIALIKLEKPIKFDGKQKPIKILKTPPAANDKVTVSGFGRIGTRKPTSDVLLSTVVPVVDAATCQKAYDVKGDELTDNMFCAGTGEHDTCQGDSGGPAVINGKLAGIVSFGYECASKELPGVYTKIVNYVDWIKEVSGLKL